MQKILIKILNELKKDAPNLDFIRGMLEVLVEEEEKPVIQGHVTLATPIEELKMPIKNTAPVDDEAKMLEAYGKAMLGKIDQSAITTEN